MAALDSSVSIRMLILWLVAGVAIYVVAGPVALAAPSTTLVIALIEAIAIAFFVGAQAIRTGVFILAALIPFGALLLAPRGTKSLLDAIIGIGSRLRG